MEKILEDTKMNDEKNFYVSRSEMFDRIREIIMDEIVATYSLNNTEFFIRLLNGQTFKVSLEEVIK